MAGAIDIVVNLFTPCEVREGSLGIDPSFMAQLRMPAAMAKGVTIPAYLKKMDRAGIDRSLLVAARAGDAREHDSAEVLYERVDAVCRPRESGSGNLDGVISGVSA